MDDNNNQRNYKNIEEAVKSLAKVRDQHTGLVNSDAIRNSISSLIKAMNTITSELHFDNLSVVIKNMSQAIDTTYAYADMLKSIDFDALKRVIIEQNEEIKQVLNAIYSYDSIKDVIDSTIEGVGSDEPNNDIDNEMLSDITLDVLRKAHDIDEAATEITEQYNQKIVDNKDCSNKKINVKEGREWIIFFIELITFILGLTTLSANNTYNITNNYYAPITNNYYEINNAEKGIIQVESVIRKDHDCSSEIVSMVEIGTEIEVIGKYRKWRLVKLLEEDGNETIGWLQNWKIEEEK